MLVASLSTRNFRATAAFVLISPCFHQYAAEFSITPDTTARTLAFPSLCLSKIKYWAFDLWHHSRSCWVEA
ncbi:hypothetical protein GGI42DRAFT_324516 [Trichoderma sp. SZMC 28013]